MMKSFNEELGKLISYKWTKAAVDSNDEDRRIKNWHFQSWGESYSATFAFHVVMGTIQSHLRKIGMFGCIYLTIMGPIIA